MRVTFNATWENVNYIDTLATNVMLLIRLVSRTLICNLVEAYFSLLVFTSNTQHKSSLRSNQNGYDIFFYFLIYLFPIHLKNNFMCDKRNKSKIIIISSESSVKVWLGWGRGMCTGNLACNPLLSICVCMWIDMLIFKSMVTSNFFSAWLSVFWDSWKTLSVLTLQSDWKKSLAPKPSHAWNTCT